MAAGDPGAYLAGLVAGLHAGYAARCREEAAVWQEESSRQVWVGGSFWERPTAAERRTERETIMREAHRAGLHDHRPIMCPWCNGRYEGDS